MTNMNQISIYYDNPSALYFPGQTVTGRVVLNHNKNILCSGMNLILTLLDRLDRARKTAFRVNFLVLQKFFLPKIRCFNTIYKVICIYNDSLLYKKPI